MVAEKCCYNCGQQGGSDLKTCTACKIAKYCGTTCQHAHWKQHKKNCRLVAQCRNTVKACNQKRSLRLLENWRQQALDKQFLFLLMADHIGPELLLQITNSSEEYVVIFDLQFDYNRRTFVPTSPPSLSPLNAFLGLSQEMRDALRSEIQNGKRTRRTSPLEASFGIALLLENSTMIGSAFSFTALFPPGACLGLSWEKSLSLLDDGPTSIKLTSSKFASWDDLCNENILAQVKNGLKVHDEDTYEAFLANALRVGTKKSLHKTHIVLVDLELGCQLGEIKRIKSFRIAPVAEVLSAIEKSPWPPETKKHYRTMSLNLTSSPWLLEGRKIQPDVALFPVVYQNKPCGLFYVECSLIAIGGYNAPTTVSACDERARQAFRQLQSVELPRVESPELH